MIVIDASTMLSLIMPDERRADVLDYVSRQMEEGTPCVPSIFPAELANGLAMAERRGRIRGSQVEDVLAKIARIPFSLQQPSFDLSAELALCQRHRLTIYDSMYLALAKRLRVTLLTGDRAILQASSHEGVRAVDPHDRSAE